MSFLQLAAVATLGVVLAACGSSPSSTTEPAPDPNLTNKEKAVAFLKSIETGDTSALAYAGAYKQHDLDIPDGVSGLTAVLQKLPKGSAKVQVVRVFEQGAYVITHTNYDFFGPKIGFDVFRFENGKIAEHWDNLQETPSAPNPSGRSMIDGPTEIVDADKRDANMLVAQGFVQDVLVDGHLEKFPVYCDGDRYIQHNPLVADGVKSLADALAAFAQAGKAIRYTRIHRAIGEGNFILVMSEGTLGDAPTAFYDLFRVDAGKIAEHWDVIQAIPPKSEWQNDNGKF